MKKKKINEAARALGRLGGEARAKNLTAEQRSDIAREAGRARQKKLREEKEAAKK